MLFRRRASNEVQLPLPQNDACSICFVTQTLYLHTPRQQLIDWLLTFLVICDETCVITRSRLECLRRINYAAAGSATSFATARYYVDGDYAKFTGGVSFCGLAGWLGEWIWLRVSFVPATRRVNWLSQSLTFKLTLKPTIWLSDTVAFWGKFVGRFVLKRGEEKERN
jgi:hypothetical protein